MADQIEAVPQLITATADGISHEIQFSAEFNQSLREDQIAFITVVTGTFKFNSGGPCTETNASFTEEIVPPIPFINGSRNIHYQCTSAGTFTISFMGL